MGLSFLLSFLNEAIHQSIMVFGIDEKESEMESLHQCRITLVIFSLFVVMYQIPVASAPHLLG